MNPEIEKRALKLVIETANGNRVAKTVLLRKVDKAAREGRLSFDDRRTPEWRFKLCSARMMLGHYEDYDGWEARCDWSANLWYNRPMDAPLWAGGKTQHLVIMGEQGIGDEILFSQCIPDAIERLGHKNITFETEDRLCSLFERSFGIECIPRQPIAASRPKMTAWICLGELLRAFRNGRHWNGKPYLKPLPSRLEEFDFAARRKAVSWEGRHGRYDPEDFHRAIGSAIDVQYNDSFRGFDDPGIDKRNDFEGLLALVSRIDRLVSVSTSIVHLAAAVGTRVDLVLAPPYTGPNYDGLQWRWGMHEDTTPWYDSVKIYRNLKVYEHQQGVLLRNARKAGAMQGMGGNLPVAARSAGQSMVSAG